MEISAKIPLQAPKYGFTLLLYSAGSVNSMANEILLESGTNEVEILEFFVGETSFGVNVSKVMQIVSFSGTHITHPPETSRGYMGIMNWRNQSIPAYDLKGVLKKGATELTERCLFIVTEFNNTLAAFLTDGVNRIHRVSWEQLKPAGEFISSFSSQVTGSLEIGGIDILMLDFEHILAEMMPDTHIYSRLDVLKTQSAQEERKQVELFFSEDSPFIRKAALNELKKLGYENVLDFDNGASSYEELKRRKESGEELPHIILTDIEMPRMDGLTLCRKIREDLQLPLLPVIFFSSLINEQMIYKCKSVGGNAWVTKPDITGIMDLLDAHSWKPDTEVSQASVT
jgi:two-component system, chemotaxis family, chemotaxis protein CheV